MLPPNATAQERALSEVTERLSRVPLLVRESWDISQESPVSKPGVRRMAKGTAANMAATLERIEQVVTA